MTLRHQNGSKDTTCRKKFKNIDGMRTLFQRYLQLMIGFGFLVFPSPVAVLTACRLLSVFPQCTMCHLGFGIGIQAADDTSVFSVSHWVGRAGPPSEEKSRTVVSMEEGVGRLTRKNPERFGQYVRYDRGTILAG